MPNSAALRIQIESTLANWIPSALTPAPRIIWPTQTTGVESLDRLLEGGLPVGALTELVGRECSGRTSLALSLCAQITQSARVCAWIDVSNTFHPESAAAVGIDLNRLLWVRCGIPRDPKTQELSSSPSVTLPPKYFAPPPIKKGLHGGSFGPHPRTEVKGMSDAVGGFLKPAMIAPRCAEPLRREPVQLHRFVPDPQPHPKHQERTSKPEKPLTRIEQALRVTDLILQGGGFSAIVLDMGSVAPEHASRVPLATWFRYRAAAERTQTSFLLLSQHACTGSSAGLVLRLQDGNPARDETTVFTGLKHQVELTRERFASSPSNVIPVRKPPQSDKTAAWQSRVTWAGCR
jgi:recombination protein RecA